MNQDNIPENPILNSPFREPSRHWQLTVDGALTQVINPGRRRSAYFVPIAPTPGKKAAEQVELELDAKDEEGRAFTPNDLVNEIRGNVERWRSLPPTQWGVTHETARLLDHWRSGGPYLHMAGALKATGAGRLFVVFGEPDIKIHEEPPAEDGTKRLSVEILGVDIFDPTTGEVRSSDVDDIVCWFVDTDYDEESFSLGADTTRNGLALLWSPRTGYHW